MAKAQEIAVEVFPHFRRNVLARSIHAYGWYAAQVGRDPAREAIVVGQVMHAIGAVCVLCTVPIAPLHYVKAESGTPRKVFEANGLEAAFVLPHYDLLYVVAREHRYTEEQLDMVERTLRRWTESEKLCDTSPHELWSMALRRTPKGGSTTYFDLALHHYRRLNEAMRDSVRKGPPASSSAARSQTTSPHC